MFLAGHTVAMVNYCATKLTATCSPMIGQFVDTMILASTDKRVVIMTHQTVSLGKYWKLFPTTLTHEYRLKIQVLHGSRKTFWSRVGKNNFHVSRKTKSANITHHENTSVCTTLRTEQNRYVYLESYTKIVHRLWLHLARSGSQSQRVIWFTIPAQHFSGRSH